jgi:hypothetical protein
MRRRSKVSPCAQRREQEAVGVEVGEMSIALLSTASADSDGDRRKRRRHLATKSCESDRKLNRKVQTEFTDKDVNSRGERLRMEQCRLTSNSVNKRMSDSARAHPRSTNAIEAFRARRGSATTGSEGIQGRRRRPLHTTTWLASGDCRTTSACRRSQRSAAGAADGGNKRSCNSRRQRTAGDNCRQTSRRRPHALPRAVQSHRPDAIADAQSSPRGAVTNSRPCARGSAEEQAETANR